MHKSDRTAAGCTVEDEPYKLLARDAEKSILAGPLSSPSEQLPFPASLKAPVPPTHDAVTVPVMFGPNITGTFTEHGNTSGLKCTGAFTGEARIGLNSNQGGASDGGRVTMNSSLSSSVYGAASTVQPASTRLLYCIKS